MATPRDQPAPILAWALYDWANSAFATTVMAGFFPVFFKAFWSQGVPDTTSTARLGLGNSLAGVAVAILAPILGALADRGCTKRRFLLIFASLGMVTTVSLCWVGAGQWPLALGLYALAAVGFSGGNVFYDALLLDVTSPRRMDWVSSLGYGLGYLGGALLFALNVWMVRRPDRFGLTDATQAIRLAFLTVGLWWALFSLPLFLIVREHAAGGAGIETGGRWGYGRRLAETFRAVRRRRCVWLFLLAYWCYIDGVDTVMRMAVDYGLSVGLASTDLLTALLVTNLVGFPAALVFGVLAQRWGAKRGLYLAIGCYLIVTLAAARLQTREQFLALAVAIGLVQGGIQALSRSYYARLIPAERAGAFFGVYNMLGKFAVVVGPLLVGATGLVARGCGAADDTASRIGISAIAVLFLVGGALLTRVRPEGAG